MSHGFIGRLYRLEPNEMIKTGDLREDSHADDDPSKLAKHAEKDGLRVLNKEAENTEPINPIGISIGNVAGVKKVKFE